MAGRARIAPLPVENLSASETDVLNGACPFHAHCAERQTLARLDGQQHSLLSIVLFVCMLLADFMYSFPASLSCSSQAADLAVGLIAVAFFVGIAYLGLFPLPSDTQRDTRAPS